MSDSNEIKQLMIKCLAKIYNVIKTAINWSGERSELIMFVD